MNFIIYLFCTFFYTGRFPKAPGTAGSLATAGLFAICLWLIPENFIPIILSFSIFIITLGGIFASNYIEKKENKKDPKFIVIDETSGQLVSFLFISPIILKNNPWLIICGFLVFRFFDILKIFPVNTAEKLPGGLGIMMDDIVAGIYTSIILNSIVCFFL